MDTAVYNEVEVLEALAAGSRTAFDTLYWRYYQPVRANILKQQFIGMPVLLLFCDFCNQPAG